jgi:hypothetical protein
MNLDLRMKLVLKPESYKTWLSIRGINSCFLNESEKSLRSIETKQKRFLKLRNEKYKHQHQQTYLNIYSYNFLRKKQNQDRSKI